jgi:hypothetical protein
MQTKSNIQLIREACELANYYRDGLVNLMEKYTIEDSIFVYRNGQVFEATKGYFEVTKEYDNIADAVRECWGNFGTMGIRIINNTDFEVGVLRNTLNECSKENKVLCIDNLETVR